MLLFLIGSFILFINLDLRLFKAFRVQAIKNNWLLKHHHINLLNLLLNVLRGKKLLSLIYILKHHLSIIWKLLNKHHFCVLLSGFYSLPLPIVVLCNKHCYFKRAHSKLLWNSAWMKTGRFGNINRWHPSRVVVSTEV